MNKKTKICIGIPTNRNFKPQTVLSLTKMIVYSKLDYYITIPTEGYNTAENRNFTVAKAIKSGCSHILFSDDDMIYPEDALEQLLSHDKDAVGVLYSVRRFPPALVIEYNQESGITSDKEARRAMGIFRCDAIGTGFLLVKTKVFEKLKPPFFGYKWHENGMVKMSTDWFFCEKLREAGFEIWADPLVADVEHIGDFFYQTQYENNDSSPFK
jgi:hypothetical protein